MTETEVYYAASPADWRKWLEENHLSKQSVWLVFHTQSSEKKSLTWSEAVDTALCFGWIDSRKVKTDHETFRQFFSKRRPGSTWSKINKQKVLQLIAGGQMTPAGYESIETAKQNGSWTILDPVEDLIIPDDLEKAFKKHKGSNEYFLSLSKTVKKMILYHIVSARRPETRQKRIDEIAELAGKNQKPKLF